MLRCVVLTTKTKSETKISPQKSTITNRWWKFRNCNNTAWKRTFQELRVRLFKQSRNRAAQYTLINCCFHHLFQVLNNVLKIIIFSLSLCIKQTFQVVFTSASINNMPLQSEIYEIKQSAHPGVLPYIIIHLNSKQGGTSRLYQDGRSESSTDDRLTAFDPGQPG